MFQDSEVYSNVVVVQHDDELIMPGDAAFTVECDFSRPRDITVSADLEADRSVRDHEIQKKCVLQYGVPARPSRSWTLRLDLRNCIQKSGLSP